MSEPSWKLPLKKKKKKTVFLTWMYSLMALSCGFMSTCTDTTEWTKNEQVEATYVTLSLKNSHV